MSDLDVTGWLIAALCAMMVGVAKTGIPGVGILVVPLMAGVLGAHRSVSEQNVSFAKLVCKTSVW